MNTKWIVALTTVAMGFMTSCNNIIEDVENETDKGYLSLSVNQDNTIITTTKATTDDMKVSVNGSEYNYTSDLSIALKTGNYTATAYNMASSAVPVLDWNKPYFYGTSSEFTISKDQTQNVSINCPLANSIISYDDSGLGSLVEIESLTISATGVDSPIDLTQSSDENKLYAKVGTQATATITVKLKSDSNTKYTATTAINVSVAKKDYKIKYAFKEAEGTGKFTITIDNSVTEQVINAVITPGNSSTSES